MNKNNKSKMANISQKWLDLLVPFTYEYNRKYTIKDLIKNSKIPLRTATRCIKNLQDKSLVSFYRRGKTFVYYLDLKRNKSGLIINLIEFYKSVKFANESKIWVLVNDLMRFGDIILFGSYAKGYANKESDVDVLMLCKKSKKITDIIKTHPFEVNTHFISLESFAKLLREENALAIEIVKSHIIFGSDRFIELCRGYYNNEL